MNMITQEAGKRQSVVKLATASSYCRLLKAIAGNQKADLAK
jgi:hypothetical protein